LVLGPTRSSRLVGCSQAGNQRAPAHCARQGANQALGGAVVTDRGPRGVDAAAQRKGVRFVGEVREQNETPAEQVSPPAAPAEPTPVRTSDGPAIAVLPFANMSADPDLRRFQLDQTKTGVRPPTVNGSVAAWRRAKRGHVSRGANADAGGWTVARRGRRRLQPSDAVKAKPVIVVWTLR
jgi:hypothetical protein